jgi:hypothetical protein
LALGLLFGFDRDAAPNMFDWRDPPGKSEWPNGDRVAAAERRIDNDRTNNPNRGRAGLERAQLELSVIESQLRLRGLLE